jgi:hypothetical protein
LVVGDFAIGFVWIGLGANAVYAVGFCGVFALVAIGLPRYAGGGMALFWQIVFGVAAVEHSNHMVGLVCIRCWGNSNAVDEFIFHVFAVWVVAVLV